MIIRAAVAHKRRCARDRLQRDGVLKDRRLDAATSTLVEVEDTELRAARREQVAILGAFDVDRHHARVVRRADAKRRRQRKVACASRRSALHHRLSA